MYFKDLSPCLYSDYLNDKIWNCDLLAVGWIEYPHRFNTCSTEQFVKDTLVNYIRTAATIFPELGYRGLHECSICYRQTGTGIGLPGSDINILIPGHNCIYAVPGGIMHYIDVHMYCPPEVFVQALMQCPLPGSEKFKDLLVFLNNGEPTPLDTLYKKSTIREAYIKRLAEKMDSYKHLESLMDRYLAAIEE